jgi:predicted dehydrogenase/threonine dehydrogenase-like Zn-dependent dehydrogenase
MNQILQHLNDGKTILAEVPCPSIKPGNLLIRTSASLVSTGTEKMLVDFSKANMIDKARQQPDKVKMVLDKVRADGLLPTLETVRRKLDQPLPMGYCNVGMVMAVGIGVEGFAVGDRVASNGKHAEVVCVPKNLCTKIPDSVSDEAATFTVIGSIALQGIRLVQPTLGETIVVTGLGLIGLVTVQLLRAQGCRVLGIDFDERKVELARSFGAEAVCLSHGENPVAAAHAYSRGRGVDAVIIAATTKSNDPVHQAALMCRKRGRIVLVGVVGLELSRADFYEKELSFQVSCSYGPGRYDPLYEEGGQDYPFGLVRWTEQRNFEAVLDMLDEGRIDVGPLVSNRLTLAQAEEAYGLVEGGKALGILLSYPPSEEQADNTLMKRTVRLISHTQTASASGKPVVGFIGAGNYATGVLIPAFSKTGARLKSVASSTGVSGVHAGKKFGFEETTTDSWSILESSDVNTVVITTRHDTHARFVCEALKAGKHVFVEKPLCLKRQELEDIESLYGSLAEPPQLMVGFNRRFAPQIVKIKDMLQSVREPKSFVMTVNAGAIPSEHWTQDKAVGGGRIIGEACHFIDLLRYLAGAPISGVQAMMMRGVPGVAILDDKVTFSLSFADGSFGTVHYLANGHKSFPKERLEVFCAGRILQLDNFRKLTGFGWPGFKKMNLWRQDKGQGACAAAFVEAVAAGAPAPISFEELVEVTRVSFEIVEMLER